MEMEPFWKIISCDLFFLTFPTMAFQKGSRLSVAIPVVIPEFCAPLFVCWQIDFRNRHSTLFCTKPQILIIYSARVVTTNLVLTTTYLQVKTSTKPLFG